MGDEHVGVYYGFDLLPTLTVVLVQDPILAVDLVQSLILAVVLVREYQVKFNHRPPYSQILPHLQCILTVLSSMIEGAICPNPWVKGQVGPPPPRLHCHSHYVL